MTNRQAARLNMYNTVISFFNQDTGTFTTIPALQIAVNEFKDAVSAIDSLLTGEEFARGGITQNKKALRQNMASLTAAVAYNVFAYAGESGKDELKSLSDFTAPRLLRFKSNELPGICKGIVATATANLPGLLAYNVTSVTLSQVTDAIAAYEAYATLPRTTATERSTTLKTLSTFFEAADNILKARMDKIVKPLKTTNRRFYQSYFTNRIIIDSYTTPTQIKGVVIAKDTNEPLRGASLTVTSNDAAATSNDAKAISNGDGKYTLKPLAPGAYTMEISRQGYVAQTITNLDVRLGQITRMNITLLRPAE